MIQKKVYFPVYRVPFSQCHIEILGNKSECELEGIGLDSLHLLTTDRLSNAQTDCFQIYLKDKAYALKGTRINSRFDLTNKNYHYNYHLYFTDPKEFLSWLKLIKAFHKISQKKSGYLLEIN